MVSVYIRRGVNKWVKQSIKRTYYIMAPWIENIPQKSTLLKKLAWLCSTVHETVQQFLLKT